MRRDSSITEIKGIGEKTKKLFEKMGVYTVGDILLHFPRNYIQYPHPVPIDEMTAEHMQTEDKLAIVAYTGNAKWQTYAGDTSCDWKPWTSDPADLVSDALYTEYIDTWQIFCFLRKCPH